VPAARFCANLSFPLYSSGVGTLVWWGANLLAAPNGDAMWDATLQTELAQYTKCVPRGADRCDFDDDASAADSAPSYDHWCVAAASTNGPSRGSRDSEEG
jgi:hypothetical protein